MRTSRREIAGLLVGHSVSLVLLYLVANPSDSQRSFRIVTAVARQLPNPIADLLTPKVVAALVVFWFVAACGWFSGALARARPWRAAMIPAVSAIALAVAGWRAADSSTDELLAVVGATVAGSVVGASLAATESMFVASSISGTQRWQRRFLRYQRALFAVTTSIAVIGAIGAPLFIFPDTSRSAADPSAVVVLGPATAERIAAGIDTAEESGAQTVAVSSALRPDGSFAAPQCTRPASVAVDCFAPKPFSTAGEMKAIDALSQEHGWTEVILLTATPHVARVTFLADRCLTVHTAVRAVDGPRSITDWSLAYLYQSLAFAKVAVSGPCA
ncbi:uncharacterized SAM-binding protein YcdF (DUF218 family) [Rathayibacter sp. PhB93]|uniref:hypothetical protein n=1 Tax=unclassified Rathayibacter TaxID=2609250 RepID=UPI000F47BF0B|nr:MULTISPECIES: hypothetical protein [unclassified Rathayibacter]ROQ06267.1 uncharacterized SAM-binding protein YcdF (DUF218 family) [Rathayibacter sp. PhB93]TDQ14024.1 uncharacterized SAM-binding protein YcdF (DUF218 family) [Rathayibacter sp. PhB1]